MLRPVIMNDVSKTSFCRLFNDVLDCRLVDDGEHLFGGGLRGREEPSSQAGNGDHGLAHVCEESLLMLFILTKTTDRADDSPVKTADVEAVRTVVRTPGRCERAPTVAAGRWALSPTPHAYRGRSSA